MTGAAVRVRGRAYGRGRAAAGSGTTVGRRGHVRATLAEDGVGPARPETPSGDAATIPPGKRIH